MEIQRYEDMNALELDAIKEIGSIGTGNAATAISQVLRKRTRMSLPAVYILGYNEAIEMIGTPEEIVAAVLVKMSGEINGIMLFILKMDFINAILESVMSKEIKQYMDLTEMEKSALEEIGNIIISSYVNALSGLTGVAIGLSIPSIAVNMLGGILSVPMAEFGYETDKLMMINGKFIVDNRVLDSNLLMMPDIHSLNYLMHRLGVD